MLVTQMWVRVSTSGSSSTAAVPAIAPPSSCARSSDSATSQGLRAGWSRVRRHVPALRRSTDRGAVDPLLHERRPQRPELGLVAVPRPARPGRPPVRGEPAKNTLMPVRHTPRGSSGSSLNQRRRTPRRRGRSSVEQREQHGLFGLEIKVERRPGQACALGQVIDRNVGVCTLLAAAARPSTRIACSRSSPDGRAERRPRGCARRLAVVTAGYFTRC